MNANYLWEKTMLALTGLADGTGSFEERLSAAFYTHLSRLGPEEPDGLPSDVAEDFKWISERCNDHSISIVHFQGGNPQDIDTGRGMSVFNELERRELVVKLMHIFLETTRASERSHTLRDVEYRLKEQAQKCATSTELVSKVIESLQNDPSHQ
jgi:hypothetical protein